MDFVIIGNSWDAVRDNPTSKHQVALELVRQGHRVLWVSGAGMRTPSIGSRSDRSRALTKIRNARAGISQVQDNIWHIAPLILPFPQSGTARRINERIYLLSIRRAMRRNGFRDAVLINFLPTIPGVIRGWQGVSVYYCVDRWESFTNYDTDVMRQLDKECSSSANLVITSSAELYDRAIGLNSNTHLISHGVDHKHFEQALSAGPPDPSNAECARLQRYAQHCGQGLRNAEGEPEEAQARTLTEDPRDEPGARREDREAGNAERAGNPKSEIRNPKSIAERGAGRDRPTDLPDGKIIGFFGLISEWVDQDLIVRIANEVSGVRCQVSGEAGKQETEEKREEEDATFGKKSNRPRPSSSNTESASVVIIGRADVDVSRLEREPNICRLGPKSFAELPAYVAHFDVGIIPFVVNDLTRAVNPIKLREMLAAGVPVVSTALPEVENYRKSIGPRDNRTTLRLRSGQAGLQDRDESSEFPPEADPPSADRVQSSGIAGKHDPEGQNQEPGTKTSEWTQIGIAIGHSHDEFVALVKAKLEQPLTLDERKALSDSVKGETWEAKVKELICLIQDCEPQMDTDEHR